MINLANAVGLIIWLTALGAFGQVPQSKLDEWNRRANGPSVDVTKPVPKEPLVVCK